MLALSPLTHPPEEHLLVPRLLLLLQMEGEGLRQHPAMCSAALLWCVFNMIEPQQRVMSGSARSAHWQ